MRGSSPPGTRNCPTLSATSASLLRARIPSRDAAKIPDVECDHRNGGRGLRAESVQR
jgi:hypothetical protein